MFRALTYAVGARTAVGMSTENDREDPNDQVIDASDDVNSPGATFMSQFNPQPVVGPGPDGFPIEHDPPGDPNPPSMVPENLVCMAQPIVEAGKNDGGDFIPARHQALPPCRFYARQLCPLPEEIFGRKFIRRLCAHPGMKTLSGAFLDLTDDAMFACELRDPPDPRTNGELNSRDERLLRRAQDQRKWRMFPTPEEAAAGKHTLSDDEFEKESKP
jgi:hypothetical protein